MQTGRTAGVDGLAVAGLGLMGGSLARDLRTSGFARRILGVETDPAHARRALDLGLVDEVLPLEKAVERAELTVVAVPVDAALELLPAALDRTGEGQTLTDFCSTKRALLERVRRHPRRARYVAGHPTVAAKSQSTARPTVTLVSVAGLMRCIRTTAAWRPGGPARRGPSGPGMG